MYLFHGNIIVPTGNPFSPDVIASYNAAVKKGDDETSSSHVQWLGPGLQLLLDHVLTVNDDDNSSNTTTTSTGSVVGIIQHLEPAESFFQRQSSSVIQQQYTNVIRMDPQTEFLCPGMIDLHIHAPQYAYTGTATDRPLMGPNGWLETYTFPAEQRLNHNNNHDLALAQKVYSRVVHTTLQHGTTTAVYFATLDLEPTKVLVNCALEQNQRALIGKVCMDRNSPENYCQSLEQNINECQELIQYIYQVAGKRTNHSSLPLVLPMVVPRFIPTCSPALLSALGNIAKEHDCHITSHISESIDEVAFSRQLDVDDNRFQQGRTDAVVFDAHNLLTDKCIMAHGVYLTDTDMDLMKQRGSAVAHCPLSNFFFAGASLPCRKLLERDNLVGLGTDVAGGYSPSMMHSSRMAVIASQALLHQQHHQQQNDNKSTTGRQHDTSTENSDMNNNDDSPVVDYRHAFYLATLGGAKSLGLHNSIGTFQVGMIFDAILLTASSPATTNVPVFETDSIADIFQKICVLGDDRNVKYVFVQGQLVKGASKNILSKE